MTRKVQWNSDALPYDQTLDQVLYEVRRSDAGESLLLDAVSPQDIIEDSDGALAFDALVTPYAKLERKMEVLQGVMVRSGESVKPVAMQVTEPFKQRGVANVAAIFELSDGQTVSIFFHNPDVTPNKMAASDEVISWKWLLNKKDITIVVAPERGEDLNIREVARRIIRLAEKNSPAFQRANGKRAERMQGIQTLKDEITALEAELATAQHELEVAKVSAEDRAARAGTMIAWKTPLAEYVSATGEDTATHKGSVERAIERGEVVPAEVLADYPELQPIKPTAPEGYAKVLQEAGKQWDADKAKQPEPERGMFERKWPLSVQEAKDQELIESFYNSRLDKTQWRVGVDQRVFETGSEALDYYYTVVKPRDEGLDKKFESEEAQQRIADVAAGKTMPAYREGDNAQYVEPDGQVKHITMRQYRQRVFDLEKETGKPNVFAKTKAEFDESVKVMPLAQPAANPDRALFQSVIDGTVADILAPELADSLEAAYYRQQTDPALVSLFEQAVGAYQNAMMAATAELA